MSSLRSAFDWYDGYFLCVLPTCETVTRVMSDEDWAEEVELTRPCPEELVELATLVCFLISY